MAKLKRVFFCTSCGYETPKWLGKCPSCGEWNTITEHVVAKESASSSNIARLASIPKAVPQKVQNIEEHSTRRIDTGNKEVNRVLGGGLVPGSLILLGGEPGIGKSTLSLQLALSANGLKTLYVSGEESAEQIKMRAMRLGINNEECTVYTETLLENITTEIENIHPDIVIIDSIQTMSSDVVESSAGSVPQIRECAAALLRVAKSTGTAIFIIGHITKDGTIAGPKILEHIVDVVLQFEGDRSYSFRVLRALKNRFGSTNESGIFSMEAGGLQEVANPAGLFLEDRDGEAAGSVIGACMEGNRPIMVEFQALVAKTPYGMPRRTAVGFDYNRVNMLLAILERRMGFDFGVYDAYINIVGGMRVTEPAADLAVATALVSSYRNKPVPKGVLAFGEVGLTGEVRRVSAPERRIMDGINLGFTKFIVPDSNIPLKTDANVQIIKVKTLEQALRAMFE